MAGDEQHFAFGHFEADVRQRFMAAWILLAYVFESQNAHPAIMPFFLLSPSAGAVVPPASHHQLATRTPAPQQSGSTD
jgi:hypothetical protein